MELISQKPYEQITIDGICEAANVGRSTFYGHYRNKDNLKRSAIDDHLVDELAQRRRSAGDASPTLVILEHVREHRHLHRGLGSRAANVAIEAIRQSLLERLREELGSSPRQTDGESEFRVQYVAGAFMAVLLWWLERGAREPPHEIEARFQLMRGSAHSSLIERPS